jgi:hypothetical protein
MFGLVDHVFKKRAPNVEAYDQHLAVTDPWLIHAIEVIRGDFGDIVSIHEKSKDLLKFGRSEVVGVNKSTLAIMPTGETEETFVSDNLINSIISTNNADTQTVKVEGHTIDGSGNLTFSVQSVTLTGQTVASLGTALARCTRIYNDDSTELQGVISVTETDSYSAGVPSTPSKVHCQIAAGQQSSEKAATSISSVDYWIVTSIYADYLEKTAGFADVSLEVRLKGKVFRKRVQISCNDGNRGIHEFKPYLIVPSNSDVRLSASASTSNVEVAGGIEGLLAIKVA